MATICATTDRQRSEALDRATAIRIERSGLKQRLRDRGRRAAAVEVARLLLEDVDLVASMEIGGLLLAVPRMGKTFAKEILRHRGLSPWDRIGELDVDQRTKLAGRLVAFAAGAMHSTNAMVAERDALDEIVRAQGFSAGVQLTDLIGLSVSRLGYLHRCGYVSRTLIPGTKDRGLWSVTDQGMQRLRYLTLTIAAIER